MLWMKWVDKKNGAIRNFRVEGQAFTYLDIRYGKFGHFGGIYGSFGGLMGALRVPVK